VQLEGTENRITVARTRAIEAIQGFNNLITVFPSSLTNSLFFHHTPLPQYGADLDKETLEKAPDVKF
jgi:LemA protein